MNNGLIVLFYRRCNTSIRPVMKRRYLVAILLCIAIFDRLHAQWDPVFFMNTPVAISPLSDSLHEMVTDGEGGAIIVWIDNKNRTVYSQRLSSAGKTVWSSPDLPLIIYEGGSSNSVATVYNIMSDQHGGVYITWGVLKSFTDLTGDIFIQRID